MTKGFLALAKLPPEKRRTFVSGVAKNSDSLRDTDVPELAKSFEMDEDTAGGILTATTMLIALATSREGSAETLAGELIDTGLVSETSRTAALEVLEQLHRDRDQLKRSMRLGALSSQTLPSFKGLETSVDLRFEFKEGQVELVAPTVIAFLRTDHSETNSFFQLSKADVNQLIEELKGLATEISAVEKWAKERK